MRFKDVYRPDFIYSHDDDKGLSVVVCPRCHAELTRVEFSPFLPHNIMFVAENAAWHFNSYHSVPFNEKVAWEHIQDNLPFKGKNAFSTKIVQDLMIPYTPVKVFDYIVKMNPDLSRLFNRLMKEGEIKAIQKGNSFLYVRADPSLKIETRRTLEKSGDER